MKSQLPQGPIAIVSAISALTGINTIVDIRVNKPRTVILDILNSPEFPMSVDQIEAMADYFEVDSDQIVLTAEVNDLGDTTMIVEVSGTCFDFSHLFQDTSPMTAPELMDQGCCGRRDCSPDSEESFEASAALNKVR